jgi:hypothetical protein
VFDKIAAQNGGHGALLLQVGAIGDAVLGELPVAFILAMLRHACPFLPPPVGEADGRAVELAGADDGTQGDVPCGNGRTS